MTIIRSLVVAVIAAALAWPPQGRAAVLATEPVRAGAAPASAGFDGVVEAVRQAVVAAQVAGAVVALDVKAGDTVKAGQVLLRIDARAADQNTAASDAQVNAARAALEVATQEYERQKQLFQKSYISEAAMQRAESNHKATRAQLAAQGAQAGAARTQGGLHVVRAPFAGVVAEVPVALGDMALPGRPLLTLYDPAALRVSAAVPQSVASRIVAGALPRIELPGLAAASRWPTPTRAQLLPTVDAATHTMQLRADLPVGLAGVAPGMFARAWLPLEGDAAVVGASLTVPRDAVVRRAEMTGLYVLDPSGRPALRQVRLGRLEGARVEVLSGVAAGERVVTDPQAAARVR